MGVKGYKVFNSDWTCRRFQYEVGKTYEMEGYPKICEKGFHFCSDLKSCFLYYYFKPENKVAEILALGNIDSDCSRSEDKACTNKIKIVREIPWNEVLELVNSGKNNLGFDNLGQNNTGHYNKGNCNTGRGNRGDSNTGNHNVGKYNTGSCNIGNCNSGNNNKGNFNTGDFNVGDFNVGEFNIANYSIGFFNTKPSVVYMFNKPTNLSFYENYNYEAIDLVRQLFSSFDISERNSKWKKLSQEEKQAILSLPNFDAGIFEEITGVNVKED